MVGRRGSAALWILAVLASACSGNDADRSEATRPEVQRMLEYVHSEGAPGVSALVRVRSGTSAWLRRPGRPAAGPDDAAGRPSSRRERHEDVRRHGRAPTRRRGRLRLNDTVERRLPGAVPQGHMITVRQLLNRTSRLYDYLDDPRFQARFRRDLNLVMSPRQAVAIAVSHAPRFPPGTSWAYSNSGYQLLGLIIQGVTREPLGRTLARRIFKPLALRDIIRASTRCPGGRRPRLRAAIRATAAPGPPPHGRFAEHR